MIKNFSLFVVLLLGWHSVLAEPCITDGVIGQALNIVLVQSEVVKSRSQLAGIIRDNSSTWDTELRFSSGFADEKNDEFSSGLQNRGQFTVKLPLSGGDLSQTKEKIASARAAFYEAQESICKTFIDALQALAMLKAERDLKERISVMEKDFLQKARQQAEQLEKEGKRELINYVELKALTRQAVVADHDFRRASRQLLTRHSALLRVYGKDRWKELKVHTTAFIKSEAPTPSSILKIIKSD